MIKVGVVGGTGYTGVELLRLLVGHPEVELRVITSRSEAGMAVADICRQGGFSDATFYKRRAKSCGMEASDARRLCELEAENAKMHKLWLESERRLADEQVNLERLREALLEAADGFDAAAEGHGVNLYQYALDIRALLEKGEQE